MPRIDIQLFTHWHDKSIRKAEKDFVDRFQKMGQLGGAEITKGIEKEAPRIRRAMLSASDSVVNLTRKTQDLTKAQQARADATERALRADREIDDQQKKSAQTERTATELLKNRADVRREQVTIGKAVLAQDRELDDMKAKHNETLREIFESEKLLNAARDIGLGKSAEARAEEARLAQLRERSKEETLDLKDGEWVLGQGRDTLAQKTDELNTFEKELAEIRQENKKSATDQAKAESDLAKARSDGSQADRDIVRLNEEVTRSQDRRDESMRRLIESEMAEDKQSSRAGHRRRGRSGAGIIGNMLTDLPFVPSGPAGAAIGGGILTILASTAEAAVTASQALATLPAVLTAAAAGFGTLAIGTAGFFDTIKNMGDADKFATSIQSLSPAAQQAALEIQYLVQGPLGELKKATQEALFDGVAEQLHNLTNVLGPTVQGLTTNLAGSMNNMFTNATGQLMSPESAAQIASIVNNIVTAFQRLEPAVAPFVDAWLKITNTGSSFLPGFADAITNAAIAFDKFITTAQQDGSLANFIQKGVDAAVALKDVIVDVAKRIYETFGNKSPEEFKNTLYSAVDAAFAVVGAIVEIAHIVNDLLGPIQAVADAVGGWENIIKAAAAAFVGFKLIGLASATQLAAGFTGAGATAATGFAGKLSTGLLAFGWAGVGAAIAIPVLGALDQKVNEWLKSHTGQSWKVDDILKRLTDDPSNPSIVSPEPPPGQQPVYSDAPRSNPGIRNGALGESPLGPAAPAPLQSWGLSPYHPLDVPPPPPDKEKKVSDKDRRDAIRAQLDPNAYMPDISGLGAGPAAGPSPGGPGQTPLVPGEVPPLQYGTNGDPYAKPGYGYQDVDQRQIANAKHQVIQEAHDVRDAGLELATLQADSLATRDELLAAEEKLADEKWQFDNAQLDLTEAQQGKWKKVGKDVNKSMTEIGAGLDKDLGISRGLAGLADNLVRFLGNLATAPLQKMLGNIIDAHPNEGKGLIGIMAAQGAFGPDWTPEGIAAGGGGNSSITLGNTAQNLSTGGSNTAQTFTGAPSTLLKDTGSVASGPQSKRAAAFVEQMFPGQIKGNIGGSRDNNTAKGTHDAGLSIDIPIAEDQRGAGGLGDQINAALQANAQALGLKYSIWRGQGKYPGGGGFNQGGHQDHIDAHFDGSGGGGGPLGMPSGMPSSGMPGPGSGVVPVFVTNFGGLGAGGMPGLGNGQGTGPLPGPSASGIGTPAGAGAEAWRSTVSQVFDKYAAQAGVNPAAKQQWVDAIVTQIDTESKGDANVPNPHDSDGHGGTQSVNGLLQYLPDTYANSGGRLTGLPYMDPIGQIAGALLAPRTAAGAPDLSAPGHIGTPGQGWGPSMSPVGGGPSGGPPLAGGGGQSPILQQWQPGLGGGMGQPVGGGPSADFAGRSGSGSGTGSAQNSPGFNNLLFGGLPQNPIPLGPVGGQTPGPGTSMNPMDFISGRGSTPGGPPSVGSMLLGGTQPVPPPGGPAAGAPTPAYQPTQQPQAPEGWKPSGSGGGGGGGLAGAAAGAIGAAIPGAGAGAQIAMQLMQRTIQYGGEVVGHLVQGGLDAMSVSDPDGGPGASLGDSWFGRVAGAIASGSPELPSSAGGADKNSQAQQQQGVDPNTQQHGQGNGQPPGPGGVNIENFVQSPDRQGVQHTANDLLAATYQAGMPR